MTDVVRHLNIIFKQGGKNQNLSNLPSIFPTHHLGDGN
jgi:hypothetical protein